MTAPNQESKPRLPRFCAPTVLLSAFPPSPIPFPLSPLQFLLPSPPTPSSLSCSFSGVLRENMPQIKQTWRHLIKKGVAPLGQQSNLPSTFLYHITCTELFQSLLFRQFCQFLSFPGIDLYLFRARASLCRYGVTTVYVGGNLPKTSTRY